MPLALIAGASGLVGSACLEALLVSSHWTRVIAVARRPLGRTDSKLEERLGDLSALSELPDMRGGSFFCALGTTIRKAGSQEAFRKVDLDLPLSLARAAYRAGARQCAVVSSVDAASGSANFYLRVKGEMEERFRKLGFDSLDIFRPSMLVGDRAESRPLERVGIVAAQLLQPLLLGGFQRYRPVEGAVVGRAMARAAEKAEPGTRVHEWAAIRALAG